MSVDAVSRMERALTSLFAPLMGTRSSGSALVHATGGDISLPANSYAVPLVASAATVTPPAVAGLAQADPQKMVKTTTTTTVTAAGVSVALVSVLGGARSELPEGTVLRWSPTIAGVEATSALDAELAGGVDLEEAPFARRVLVFEGIGEKDAADAFWRASVGAFPALVISWEGSAPGQRVGRGRNMRSHHFRVYVVTSRSDAHGERRDEGKRLLETCAEVLADRAAADGESFSNPPIKLGAAGRLSLAATSYIYWLEFDVAHSTLKRELRPAGTFAPWTASQEQLQTDPTEAYPDPEDAVTLVDQKQDMT